MRKHKIRHLFHLVVDFIPLLLIPVFMIYSHRHDLTQRTEVDIQYKYQSNEVNSADDIILGNVYQFNIQDYYILNIVPNEDDYIVFELLDDLSFEFLFDDATSDLPYMTSHTCIQLLNYENRAYFFTYYSYEQFLNYDYTLSYVLTSPFGNDINIVLLDYHIADLEYMYQFFSYTDYNVIESVSVNDTESDIMSQFTYSMYNAVTKYFNMDEVINLGAVHTWINDNVFNGNMPMGVTIVWHLICYQFVVDLIFLIYGLFMFIIDFADKCMTSFYDKSFGGGR